MANAVEGMRRRLRPVRNAVSAFRQRYFPPTYPDMEEAFHRIRPRIADLTMTSVERQYALWKAVEHIEASGVEGDFVECGVWRGGSSMLAAIALQDRSSTERDLWLYDTFKGMTEPGDFDLAPDGSRVADQWREIDGKRNEPVFAYGSLSEVKANMAITGYPDSRVHYVQGPVEETIPGTVPDRIALLRLDTDWYESTRHELEHLWSLLIPGGVLIVDDYGYWAGSKRATDEFFADRDDAPLLIRVDCSGRVGIKPA